MFHIQADNVDELYSDTLWTLYADHLSEETRGGRVMSFPEPVMWSLTNPRNRVLINPVRDANPFFHVMEFIWMMSGMPQIDWVKQFSKNYGSYAEDGQGYGHRWRQHFGKDRQIPVSIDQIEEIIWELKHNPESRRAVLGMWDPSVDLIHMGRKEVPCNTHIYFRHVKGKLDMTVLNRSNDIIWGALGANVVHMTMLHELIAFGAGIPLGTYRAFSNNAHVYVDLPRREEMFMYKETELLVEQCRPILREGEKWEDFLRDCEGFLSSGEEVVYRTEWMNKVAVPMLYSFKEREHSFSIQCPAWRKACELWLERRKK